jgi:uncharacterized membrane protein
MSTINGLPAHPLLVHFVVVLAPLTAALVILCAVWPAARRRFVWLLLPTALFVLVLTPITTSAGESLNDRLGKPPLLDRHAELGDTMLWFAIALALVAAAVTWLHYAEVKSKSLKPVLVYAIAALSIVVGAATVVQTYRIGDSGAQAVWGGQPG